MSYTFKEIEFLSSDGKNTIHAELYIPDTAPRGVLQISHGMIDYVGRYDTLVEFLTSEGYVVAGNDHLGHGGSVKSDEDFGFFAEKDGYAYVIEDLHKMNEILHNEYPALPVFMLGHSMGSFLARLYAVKYPDTIRGLIIHGTGGKNPMLAPGKLIVKLIRAFRGPRHRSKLVEGLAFGSYNARFDKSEGEWAWLTRDLPRVASRNSDKRTAFKFTLAGYLDLFEVLGGSNSKKWYASYPKEMPTLVMSGDMDPVGNYGKGVKEVYDGLVAAGVKNVTLKLYEGARHELFNETNRHETFLDILEWLGATV